MNGRKASEKKSRDDRGNEFHIDGFHGQEEWTEPNLGTLAQGISALAQGISALAQGISALAQGISAPTVRPRNSALHRDPQGGTVFTVCEKKEANTKNEPRCPLQAACFF